MEPARPLAPGGDRLFGCRHRVGQRHRAVHRQVHRPPQACLGDRPLDSVAGPVCIGRRGLQHQAVAQHAVELDRHHPHQGRGVRRALQPRHGQPACLQLRRSQGLLLRYPQRLDATRRIPRPPKDRVRCVLCDSRGAHHAVRRRRRRPRRAMLLLLLFSYWCSLAHSHSRSLSLSVSRSIDSTLKLWNINSPRTPLQTFIGHENKMRFTGVDSAHDLIACGSETNAVIAYAKPLGSPALTHSFNSTEIEKVRGSSACVAPPLFRPPLAQHH